MELIKGDCLEVMKDLSDNIAQVFFCDLPYGEVGCKWDTQIDLSEFWKQALRIGKENCVYCFTATMKFAHTLISSNQKMFKYDMVWAKSVNTNPMFSTFRHMPRHELLLVFYRKKPKWNKDKYHKRIKDKDIYTQNSENCFSHTSKVIRNPSVRFDPPLPHTLLTTEYKRPIGGKSIHPTRKPVDLIVNLLKYWTDPDDLVIDPTMGSGATGEACKELGLRFIGIEKDEKWFGVAQNRVL